MKGRKRSDEGRKKISDGMKRYWDNIPYENKEYGYYNDGKNFYE